MKVKKKTLFAGIGIFFLLVLLVSIIGLSGFGGQADYGNQGHETSKEVIEKKSDQDFGSESNLTSVNFLADTLASNLFFWIMMTMGFIVVSSFLRVFNRGYYY